MRRVVCETQATATATATVAALAPATLMAWSLLVVTLLKVSSQIGVLFMPLAFSCAFLLAFSSAKIARVNEP